MSGEAAKRELFEAEHLLDQLPHRFSSLECGLKVETEDLVPRSRFQARCRGEQQAQRFRLDATIYADHVLGRDEMGASIAVRLVSGHDGMVHLIAVQRSV